MSKKPVPIASEQATQSASGKRYLDDFKRDAVRLVTEERYTFKAAATAVGVSEKSLRDWHAKFAPQPSPCGEDASLEELREENKRLRQQLKRAELEREILKKATAYFSISRSSSARLSCWRRRLFSSRSSSSEASSPQGLGCGANLACQSRRLFSLTPTAVAAALNVYRSSVTKRTASRLKSSKYRFPLADCVACSDAIGTGFLLMANSFHRGIISPPPVSTNPGPSQYFQ